MEISITRSATINTGNFQSCRPTVTLTRDVDPMAMKYEYERLSNLADALWALELLSMMEEIKSISELGTDRYAEMLKRQKDSMLKIVGEYRK